MTIGLLTTSWSVTAFTFGAHLDYSPAVECDECQEIHDTIGLSLGFVFLRLLFILRIGCKSEPQ